MSQLYKDERSKNIDPHYTILEKFFLGHIIKYADLKEFEQSQLKEHQKARNSSGDSVLQ